MGDESPVPPETIRSNLAKYRVPIIFLSIGIIFCGIAVLLFVKTLEQTEPIRIQHPTPVVPTLSRVTPTNSALPTPVKININTSGTDGLDTLFGVGPATAKKIINNRPYSSLEELVTKHAIGASLFDKIKERLTY